MYMLRIEHSVLNYDGWKQAFDSDPVGRKAAGVRRYRVLRGSDKPDHIMIDLEFDTQQQAEALLAGLRVVWGRIEGQIILAPEAHIAEIVETKEY